MIGSRRLGAGWGRKVQNAELDNLLYLWFVQAKASHWLKYGKQSERAKQQTCRLSLMARSL